MTHKNRSGHQVVVVGTATEFHTLTWPVPSPVKNRPPGPVWMARISCLANILPFSENLNMVKSIKIKNRKSEQKQYAKEQNISRHTKLGLTKRKSNCRKLTMVNHRGGLNCHYWSIARLACLPDHASHKG
jgi:hypothetical protein